MDKAMVQRSEGQAYEACAADADLVSGHSVVLCLEVRHEL